ncbi:MAG: methylase domain protein [Phycisphaerales bacterium]|nr:methylase domain protein [Phycisphaerales bacterium]
MSQLNYLRIAQILGGRITETQEPRFGAFGAAAASIERFRLIEANDATEQIPREQNQAIATAFEKVRNGYEPDRVLVDPVLSREFLAECRKRGVTAPQSLIYKRLQSFRKSSTYGIKLEPTTRDAELIPEPYFYAAELGYVQLTYRRQASVDDVLTDPEIGKEFVELCKGFAPNGSAMIFKWAALRLRKMRAFDKREKREKLLSQDPEEIEEQLKPVGTLAEFSSLDLPKEGGIFSFAEQNGHSKYLYIGASRNLRKAVRPFEGAKPFLSIGGRFWKPSLTDITVNAGVLPNRWHGLSRRDLSLRLIQERNPLFNMPVHIENDAA